jgi:hypothetical protein
VGSLPSPPPHIDGRPRASLGRTTPSAPGFAARLPLPHGLLQPAPPRFGCYCPRTHTARTTRGSLDMSQESNVQGRELVGAPIQRALSRSYVVTHIHFHTHRGRGLVPHSPPLRLFISYVGSTRIYDGIRSLSLSQPPLQATRCQCVLRPSRHRWARKRSPLPPRLI